MNILVIGNGFDLAHGLPTSYREFLNFIDKDSNAISKILQQNGLSILESTAASENIKKLSNDNYWVEHFLDISNCGENWIDFESEISKEIQRIEKVIKLIKVAQENPESETEAECINEMECNYEDLYVEFCINIKYEDSDLTAQIKEKLLSDLNRLIHCLELYMCQYVNKIRIAEDRKLNLLQSVQFDCVLSFNYTNTFERFYGSDSVQYHYIHGKADITHTDETRNLILGIDEYLTGDARNTEIEFIEFRKFFQRIYKGTGALYKSWLCSGGDEDNDIYVLGHSLDITDKDILKELILSSYTKVHILHHDKNALAHQITNLVRLIGQDKLIEYTYNPNPHIDFIEQK